MTGRYVVRVPDLQVAPGDFESTMGHAGSRTALRSDRIVRGLDRRATSATAHFPGDGT